jgi:trehalose 6-phosphate phosphatase
MKDLLRPRYRRALDDLLAPGSAPPLLAFDYDGVLAPLLRDPAGAPMPRRTRALVTGLAARLPVAIVSGRSFPKLHRVVRGVTPWLVGSHGQEYLRRAPPTAAALARVRAWERRVAAAVKGVPGIFIEHKRSSFSVHWAEAPRRAEAARAVTRAARALRGVRLVSGKNLVNVLPAAFPTKGDAVRRLVAELGCRRALYVGDDVTDEDVFALPRRLVLGVHVGDGPSRAEYRLSGRAEVNALLSRLLALAEAWPAPTGRPPWRRAAGALARPRSPGGAR